MSGAQNTENIFGALDHLNVLPALILMPYKGQFHFAFKDKDSAIHFASLIAPSDRDEIKIVDSECIHEYHLGDIMCCLRYFCELKSYEPIRMGFTYFVPLVGIEKGILEEATKSSELLRKDLPILQTINEVDDFIANPERCLSLVSGQLAESGIILSVPLGRTHSASTPVWRLSPQGVN